MPREGNGAGVELQSEVVGRGYLEEGVDGCYLNDGRGFLSGRVWGGAKGPGRLERVGKRLPRMLHWARTWRRPTMGFSCSWLGSSKVPVAPNSSSRDGARPR